MFTGIAKVLQIRKGLESQEPIEKTHRSKPPWWLCSFARGHIHKPHDICQWKACVEDMAWKGNMDMMSSQQLVSGSHLDPSSPMTDPEVGHWMLSCTRVGARTNGACWGMLGHVWAMCMSVAGSSKINGFCSSTYVFKPLAIWMPATWFVTECQAWYTCSWSLIMWIVSICWKEQGVMLWFLKAEGHLA